jgi:imidazole glycerol-phosphate synthase subunit HisH
MIAILNYGIGNLRSVEKAFQAVGRSATVTSDPSAIRSSNKLVLPGVGAFGECAHRLSSSGLDELVLEAAKENKPILGLCVGLQLMFDEGHEFGVHKGLGLLPGRVVKFPESGPHVPQIGWNQIERMKSHPLLEQIPEGTYFYFVHSYHVETEDREVVLAETTYGLRYPSICARGSICGVQFHPEKSQAAGLKLLSNFASM